MNAWMGTRAMLLKGASWSGRERNCVFLNIGDARFVDISAISAANCIGDGRTLIPIDWDGDGALDLLLKNRTGPRLQLFHNRSPERGNFMALTLEGVTCNRDAIGARVEMRVDGRTVLQTLQAGSGYLGQSPKLLYFGLGESDRISLLTVTWPDGTQDAFSDLLANRRYHLRQGEKQLETRASAATPVPSPFASLAATPEVPSGRARRRVPLVDRLALEGLTIPSYSDPQRKIASLAGTPALLNLWGTDCAPCIKELGDFKRRREDFAAKKLRIVPLCTDQDPDAKGVERARDQLERFGLLENAGYADKPLLEAIEVVLDEVIGSSELIPLPMSLLVDEAGQLCALYLGPVDVDRVLRDANRSRRATTANDAGSGNRQLLRGTRLFPVGRNYPAMARAFRDMERMDLARFFRLKAPKITREDATEAGSQPLKIESPEGSL
ncbi:MAG: hypothetical protein CMJ89_11490 [Planctomycetes bacterium]|nr:hypothetical protein [Planctomycetota bacterium]